MTELLTAAQMRAIEQTAIDSGEVTGLELMERAGRGVVEAIFEEWPELAKTSYRAVVLCGPGNNGGDGFVVARLLRERSWEVEVFLYGEPEKMPPDARVNYERWRELGEVQSFEEMPRYHCYGSTLVIDAFFGIGLNRPVPEKCRLALRDVVINMDAPDRPRLVSIDIPSFCCSDSGRILKVADDAQLFVASDLTVTFHAPKIGHLSCDGPSICGKMKTVSIGVKTFRRGVLYETGSRDEFARSIELEFKPLHLFKNGSRGDHKYCHGHALILSGGVGLGGAARLAARGALRIGAGLVTLACPSSAVIENAAQLNAIMIKSLKDDDVLQETLIDERINAICIGPGLGVHLNSIEKVKTVLAAKRATVLDADALTVFREYTDMFFEHLHNKCVLTPHAGEFARLFPDIAEKLEAPATTGPAFSKVDATREAAKRAGCVVLFKGPDTVIADPSGRCSVNSAHYERSAPWLATAGSGDVLAGFITGLLARGFGPMQAAETAAWLHVECALSFGPGLIAEDLPEELPKVFRALNV